MRRLSSLLLLIVAVVAPQPHAFGQADDLVLTDAGTLARLEETGASFGRIFGRRFDGADNAQLAASVPGYLDFVDRVTRDVADEKRAAAQTSATEKGLVTVFDPDWLRLEGARFDLVAIVNRFDQILRAPATCGDLRLVYRLSHRTADDRLRLPFFVSTLFRWSASGLPCRRIAELSRIPGGRSPNKVRHLLAPDSIYRPFLDGTLPPDRFEINFQISLWPPIAPEDLVDEGHYLMRTFSLHPETRRLATAKLENTPNRQIFETSSDFKRLFIEWLKAPSTLAAIDRGTLQMPEMFLAEKAISVSPFGLNRLSNRPTTAWLPQNLLDGVDLSGYSQIKSKAAFLRRLDSLSCTGCHQSLAVASFHMLGEPHAHANFPFTEAVAYSKYVQKILAFRRQIIATVHSTGTFGNFKLPATERPQSETSGRFGEACGAGDPGFATWDCAAGLTCSTRFPAAHFAEVGQCLPAKLEVATAAAGDPCDDAILTEVNTPHLGRLQKIRTVTCEAGKNSVGICATSINGFPGGICSAECNEGTSSAACISTPILGPFSRCVDETHDFKTCLGQFHVKALLPRCATGDECRDDYVCATALEGEMICAPPYFLASFSLRAQPPPQQRQSR